VVTHVMVLAVGIVSISFAAIFIRFCDDVPAIMIATYRLVLSSAIMASVFKLRGRAFHDLQRRDLLLCSMGGGFLSLHFIAWITSLKYTSVASSVVLVTTNPIFVGIFSWLLLREQQSSALIAGITLSFLGSVIIALSDGGLYGLTLMSSRALWGNLLALAGAAMASGYLIVGSKVRERLDILTYVTVVYGISAVLLLTTAVASRIPFTGYAPSSYLFLLLLAMVPQLIGHTTINWSLKHLKTSMVAIAIMGEPIGASLLAYVFFSETIDGLQGIGMIMIFAAIAIASTRGRKMRLESRVD